MSYEKQEKLFIKLEEKDTKSSQFTEEKVISYNKELNNLCNDIDNEVRNVYEEIMKKGYEEMGKINLRYAQEGEFSQWYDSIEYETWLCGV